MLLKELKREGLSGDEMEKEELTDREEREARSFSFGGESNVWVLHGDGVADGGE